MYSISLRICLYAVHDKFKLILIPLKIIELNVNISIKGNDYMYIYGIQIFKYFPRFDFLEVKEVL